MDANVKFLGCVAIFVIITVFCLVFPTNIEIKNEILSTEQAMNKEKLGIKIDKERSGGWISTTSTNMTYSVIANNGNIMNKTMEINDDDIEYVKGYKNMIFYLRFAIYKRVHISQALEIWKCGYAVIG